MKKITLSPIPTYIYIYIHIQVSWLLSYKGRMHKVPYVSASSQLPTPNFQTFQVSQNPPSLPLLPSLLLSFFYFV